MKTDLKKLTCLIRAYSSTAEALLQSLKKGLGVDGQLLSAYKNGRIPQSGQTEGIAYQIHGGGVVLFDGTTQIDIQLGADDFAGAVDAWRLAQYAQVLDNGLPSVLMNAGAVRGLLDELLSGGIVKEYPYLGEGFYAMQ